MNKIYYSIIFIVTVILVEIVATKAFPMYSDDKTYKKMVFDRVMNSAVILNSNKNNYSRKFGFLNSPNWSHSYQTSNLNYSVKTNSLGFRTKEIIKKNNEYRVMLIGDSYIYGWGVNHNEMISSQIEDISKKKHDKLVSVFNFGHNGYNNLQELLVAKTFFDTLDADHIILGLFIGNDILANSISYINEQGNYSIDSTLLAKMKSRVDGELAIFNYFTIGRIIANRFLLAKVRYKISKDVISRTYDILDEFNNFANFNNIAFSVVVIYPPTSSSGTLAKAFIKSKEVGIMIDSWCKQNSIDVINMIDYINSKHHKNDYYIPNDGHTNSKGNFIIANAIYDAIKKDIR